MVQIRYKKEILYYEGGEAPEQAAQRSCGCSVPGSVQGQVGQDFEQPGLVEGVPAHGGGLELGDLQCPFQPKSFYDYMKYSLGKLYGFLLIQQNSCTLFFLRPLPDYCLFYMCK